MPSGRLSLLRLLPREFQNVSMHQLPEEVLVSVATSKANKAFQWFRPALLAPQENLALGLSARTDYMVSALGASESE
jgi:hypothetical protein